MGVPGRDEAGLLPAGSLALVRGEGRTAGVRVREVGVCALERGAGDEEEDLESKEAQLAGLAGREVMGRGESGRRTRPSIRRRDTGEEPRRWSRRERRGATGGFPSFWVVVGRAFGTAARRIIGADLGCLQVGSAQTGLRGIEGVPSGPWRSFSLEEALATFCAVGTVCTAALLEGGGADRGG